MLLTEDLLQPNYISWRQVPVGLQTRRQWRERHNRLPRRGERPAALVDGRIPLFAEHQTRNYRPKAVTLQFRAARDTLLRFLNPRRDQYSFQPEPGCWPRVYEHLSVGLFEEALTGKELLALNCQGDYSRWFAFDLDAHDGDLERFLARLRAILALVDQEGDDRFIANVNMAKLSGCHIYVFSPTATPFAKVIDYAKGLKARLMELHPDLGFDCLEVYPTRDKNPLRMPICRGRTLVLDHPVEGKCREQAVRLAEWIEAPGTAIASEELLKWLAQLGRRTVAPQMPPAPQVQPVPEPEPITAEDALLLLDDFLGGPPTPRSFLTTDEWLLDGNRATTANVRAEWDRLQKQDLRAARDFLDSVAPPAGLYRQVRDRASSMGWKVANEWDQIAKQHGWQAGLEFLNKATAQVETKRRSGEQDGRIAEYRDRPAVGGIHQDRPAMSAPIARHSTVVPKAVASGRGPKITYAGRFCSIQNSFWNLKERPADDTIGSIVAPHARFCLQFGKTIEEIIEFYRRELPRRDTGFSDRLADNPERLLRNIEGTLRKIEDTNGYQPDAERSSKIFANLARAFRAQALDPLDPAAFGRYRRAGGHFEVTEAKLDYEARLLAKEHLRWLHADIAVVYAVVKRILGFVESNPGRQLAAALVPGLCRDLPVEWLCASDIAGNRCKKGERVLAALRLAGILQVERSHRWFGKDDQKNKATEYRPGPAVTREEQEEGGTSTIADMSAPLPPPWFKITPQSKHFLARWNRYHGPPRQAA